MRGPQSGEEWESDSRALLARGPSSLDDGGGTFQAWARAAGGREANGRRSISGDEFQKRALGRWRSTICLAPSRISSTRPPQRISRAFWRRTGRLVGELNAHPHGEASAASSQTSDMHPAAHHLRLHNHLARPSGPRRRTAAGVAHARPGCRPATRRTAWHPELLATTPLPRQILAPPAALLVRQIASHRNSIAGISNRSFPRFDPSHRNICHAAHSK